MHIKLIMARFFGEWSGVFLWGAVWDKDRLILSENERGFGCCLQWEKVGLGRDIVS